MGKASKQVKSASTAQSVPKDAQSSKAETNDPRITKDLAVEHLPPIGLVFTVIVCSGSLFMFAFRDVFATGRNIGGEMDEAFLVRRSLFFCIVDQPRPQY